MEHRPETPSGIEEKEKIKMIKFSSLLVFLVALFAFAPKSAWAQCEYATADGYYTQAVANFTLHTSVVVEGQVICSYNGMEHTYYATNTLRNRRTGYNVGYTQNEGPTANYVSLENDESVPVQPDDIVDFSGESQVWCPIMGYFFTTSWNWPFHFAYTRVASLGTRSNCSTDPHTGITICDLNVQTWCTIATTPPDMNLTEVRVMVSPIPPSSFYDAYGVGVWTGSGYYFNNLTSYAIGLSSPQPLANCTKTH
jgi:hypothetical protein